jgi:Rieske Fe-S protein
MALEVTQHQTADETETCCGSSRRAVLRAAGVGGAAAAVGLAAAACSSAATGNNAASSGGQSTTDAGSGSQTSAAASSSAASGSGSNANMLAATADVPVDGGKIVTADGGVVITQPASGTFKAFTAICTHQGCTVGSVSNNQITCPCHGSVFSAKDGSVISGPASAPLASKNITVSGGNVYLA